MRKGKELIGKTIVALDGGQKLDSVRDLVFDPQAGQLLALLIDEGGWFRAARVLPFTQIRSIGDDAVVVESHDAIVSASTLERVPEILADDNTLIGTTLMTTDGKNLGKLADLYFDEQTGRVVGYDVTGGVFADLATGRSFVPAPQTLNIGKDVAFVPPEVADAMQEQVGGLQGALSSASQSISTAAGSVSESVKTAAGNLAEGVKERQKTFVVGKTAGSDVIADDGTPIAVKGQVITAQRAELADQHGALGSLFASAGGGVLQDSYENLATASRERQKAFVVGKTAGADVSDDHGAPIVYKGEVISATQADLAEARGALGRLLAAAGGGALQGAAGDVRERLAGDPDASTLESTLGRRVRSDVRGPAGTLVAAEGQIVTGAVIDRARMLDREAALVAAVGGAARPLINTADTGDRLAAGAQNVKEGASNLLDRAKEWLGGQRDQAEEAMEERRIQNAIGRPTNRVVLDPQDNIILNVGEIITHRAVEQARAGGVLDILLGSVSTVEPQIDPVAVRPDAHGQAALESQDLDKPATTMPQLDIRPDERKL